MVHMVAEYLRYPAYKRLFTGMGYQIFSGCWFDRGFWDFLSVLSNTQRGFTWYGGMERGRMPSQDLRKTLASFSLGDDSLLLVVLCCD